MNRLRLSLCNEVLPPNERVNDGLPETLEEVIAAWGHRYFKLKVGGQIDADLARLEAIATVLDCRCSRTSPW